MASVPQAQLTHVGMFVRNLNVMKEFYCRVLGLVVTDAAPYTGRELAFLSRDPDEHHQLVMIADPERQLAGPSVLNQVSFRVRDLEALRVFYRQLAEQRVDGLEGRNHGNSWSLYFFDPEGNKIEIYVPTPWHVAQPWRAPLDLTQSIEAIMTESEALVQQNPTMRPMSEWSQEMAVRMAGAGGVQ